MQELTNMIKTCKICGKQFESKSNRKICYDDHYKICPICGESVLWNKIDDFKTCKKCSQKARVEKQRKTLMEKYGVDNPMKIKEIQAKVAKTNLERYGAANPMSNPEIARKSVNSRADHMDEIVQHIKDTWMKKYGVDNVSKCPEIIDKITETFVRKYGVKRAIDVPEFRQKMIDTMLERYNVPWYVQSKEYRTNDNFRISKINELFGETLKNSGIKYEPEYRIDFKNYDFYLPDFNTLVELDPSYTHNVIGNHWNKQGIDKNYHLEKTKLAVSNGFRCVHIFDWDDWGKIINTLTSRIPIYARNCEIVKLFPEVTDRFLLTNHLQGTCRGQDVSLGLVSNDELYMVMTFGKPRYNKNYAAEILRFATRTGYRVIGGASKLFKYFVDTFSVNSIISYCDLSKFDGKVYQSMGMQYLKSTAPQEIWSKDTNKITANLLRQRGYDQLFNTNYGKGASNEQLMIDNGWLPVYDCGQGVYVYGSNITPITSRKAIDLKPKQRQPKKCAFCGKEFIPNSNKQKYCKGPHYRNCPVCGKEYLEDNVENLKKPPVACSYECRAKLISQTKSES